MQYNIDKWRLKTIFLIVVVLLSGCTQDYLSDAEIVDEKVVALEEKDKELRLALETGIENLRNKIMSTLTETDNRLNSKIDDSMATLAQTVKTKIGEVNNFLTTELATRTAECNSKIGVLKNSANNAKTSYETALANTKSEVEEAIANGETERAAELTELKNHYEKVVRETDSINTKTEEWQVLLQSIIDMDYTSKFTAIESRLASLESYQLDDKIDNLKSFLNSYSKEKLTELTLEDMNEFTSLLHESEERLSDSRDLASDALGLADDIESTAEDAISDVESILDEIESSLNHMEDELSGADISEAWGIINDIENDLDSFDGLLSLLEEAADGLSDLMEMSVDMGGLDNLGSSDSGIQTAIDQVETAAEICAELISELFGEIENWKSDHPWWDD